MAPLLLITGATDGVGLALARHYAALGWRLVLVGRRPLDQLDDRLFQAANYCQVDLSDLDAAETIGHWLNAQGIRALDAMIHNAGIGWAGAPVDQPIGGIRELLAVNLEAPLAITHRLRAWLGASSSSSRSRLQAQPQVVFISSITATLPCPDYAVYAASKAALDGFARALRLEWADQGVVVQTIWLGPVRTAIHAKAGLDLGAIGWDRFPTSEATAARIARAIASRRFGATIGLTNRLLRVLGLRSAGLLDRAAKRKAARG